MSARYYWLKDTDAKIAAQLQKLSRELTEYAELFGIESDELLYLQQGSAAYAYMQLQMLPAVRNFAPAITKVRDNFEVDKEPQPFVFPIFELPAPPEITVQLSTNFFEWCHNLIKRIHASPHYNEAIGTILGITVSRYEAEVLPQIRTYKALPGGVFQLNVYRGGQPMILVEAKVDDGPWELKASVVASKIKISVPAGAAHTVQMRSRFAKRDGTPLGDYSPIITASSLA